MRALEVYEHALWTVDQTVVVMEETADVVAVAAVSTDAQNSAQSMCQHMQGYQFAHHQASLTVFALDVAITCHADHYLRPIRRNPRYMAVYFIFQVSLKYKKT